METYLTGHVAGGFIFRLRTRTIEVKKDGGLGFNSIPGLPPGLGLGLLV